MLRHHARNPLLLAGYGNHGYTLTWDRMKFEGLTAKDYGEQIANNFYRPISGEKGNFLKLRRIQVSRLIGDAYCFFLP